MVTLKFRDVNDKKDYIEVEALGSSNLHISLQSKDFKSIIIDKSTAIKLSKELRKQIALLD